VLLEYAVQQGYDADTFSNAMQSVDTGQHIKNSRALLAKVGGQGFPTFALEQDGQFTLVDIGPWLGKPEAFAQWLNESFTPAAGTETLPVCGLDGCV